MQNTAVARVYRAQSENPAADEIALDYEGRFLRRKMLRTRAGQTLLVDLEKTTSLDHGGVLVREDGAEVTITAAPEALLEVRGDNLARIAWHVGNRHTPCQVEHDRLLIQRDHVIRDMLLRIGAAVREVEEPFTPEGGAYGHGRTHGHAH